MSQYIKIVNGEIVQRQPYPQEGFVEAPDGVVCGQLWDAGTLTFVDPAAPDTNPYIPLKPYQFWGAVRALGYEQDLQDWVAAIADPVEKGIASAMLEYSLEFRRDHPLMETARQVLGMSEVELDTLWIWGLTL